MNVRRLPRSRGETRLPNPTVSTLFQKPLTAWYADWKASRGTAQAAVPTDPRPVSRK